MDRNRRLTLSVTEAAELLGISRALAYELVARGELPSLQFGRRLVVPWRAIERLLASCEENATTQGIPTTDHDSPTTTERDHMPTTRPTRAETEPEHPTPIAKAHAPNPTHTEASAMRSRSKQRTERVPPRKSS